MDFHKAGLKKLNDRRIDVSTYDYDAQTVLIEGRLVDHRHVRVTDVNDEERPPGILHDLLIRMLIDVNHLTIKKVACEMHSVPNKYCREVENSLEAVEGITISAGFTERVKNKVGGKQGCAHLVALLLSMAPIAIQAALLQAARKSVDTNRLSEPMMTLLEDTCWPWRKDGPLMAELNGSSLPRTDRK
jgi:hypothetical protein